MGLVRSIALSMGLLVIKLFKRFIKKKYKVLLRLKIGSEVSQV